MKKCMVLVAAMIMIAGMVSAQEVEGFESAEIADTLIANVDTVEVDPDPEWYVAPLNNDSVMARHNAPRRAAANNCPIDSIRIFDVDSVLTAVTVYEYGDTLRTLTWAINPDGSRKGDTKEEYCYVVSENKKYGAKYAWDNTTNDWKGVSRGDTIYNASNKEISRTAYVWINNGWVANKRYTYQYNASNWEIEFLTYTRNTTTNELELSQGRYREWYNASKTISDIQYSAHNGTTWTAGTKTESTYDGSGRDLTKTKYASYSNGTWVASSGSTKEKWEYTGTNKTYYEKQVGSATGWVNNTKEVWEYTNNKNTLYEKYTGSGSDWTKNSKKVWAFNAANLEILAEVYGVKNGEWNITSQSIKDYNEYKQQILLETYTFSSGIKTGTKKEQYYKAGSTANNDTLITYKWVAASSAWVYSVKTVTKRDNANVKNIVDNCKYNWNTSTNAWVGIGTRTLKTFNGATTNTTEVITQSWSTEDSKWINNQRTTAEYSGSNITQESSFTWQENTWVGTSRKDYTYNAQGKNDTVKTYIPNGTDWIYSTKLVNTYNAAGTIIMTHNSKWEESKWKLTSMTRTDEIKDASNRVILNAKWSCGADSAWIGVQKDTLEYNSAGKLIYQAKYSSWANNDWVPTYVVTNTYNGNDQLILAVRMEWINNQWQGKYKYVYDINDKGQTISSAYYDSWNKDLGTWIGKSKTDTEYDESGNISFTISSTWGGNNDWRITDRSLFQYDAANRLVEQITQQYVSGDWVNVFRLEEGYKGSVKIKSNDYKWRDNAWQFSRRSEKAYDEDEQSKLRREIEGVWNDAGVVSSFTDNLYFYDCDHPYYTIRFENYDGSLLQSSEVKETKKPVYKGETPTKPATEQNTYTFKGWTPAIVTVTGDATYTAEYDSVVNRYRITWLNADDVEVAVDSLEYGAMPSHEDVVKPNTSEWAYLFAGWSPAITTVTGDATYKAQLDSVRNGYRIIWLDVDDTELAADSLSYGAMPSHEYVLKANTAEWTYSFVGWTPEIVSVTADATYKAQIDSVRNRYRITWLDADDTELAVDSLAYGATPSREYVLKANTAEWTYTFVGWEPAITSVTGDATYKAQIDSVRNRYRVTWLDADDTEIAVDGLVYGATPSREYVLKANTAEWTYSFVGWTPEIATVTGDATYKAQIDSVRNRYRITWLDVDDTELVVDSLAYGATPSREYVLKANTAEWTYSFVGWTPEIATVTGDATYKAQIDSVRNRYRIVWLDADDTEIAVDSLAYGATPSREYVLKANTAEWTYSFVGWTPEIAAVSADATYKAQIDSVRNSYLITFKNGVDTLQSTLVAYGTMPVYGGETPTKQADAQYTYSFNGWDAELVAVNGETTYNATFSSTVNTYTITWLLDDGTKIDEQSVAYGTTPSHTDAHKDNTAQYTITFVGWDKAFAAVTGDETYTAVFDSVANSYTVIFYFEDGVTVLDSKEFEYGEMPSTSLIPSLPATPKYTYTFAGWSPELQPVTGNATYTPVFDSIVNTYTVTFVNYNNMVLQSSQVPYDDVPEYTGETPSKPSSYKYHYVFTGWTPEIVAVTGDARYKAVYDQVLNRYTILFYDEDGITILDSVEVDHGEMPETSVIPTKADDEEYTYTFAGWSPKIVTATKNASYTATYTATRKTEGLWDVEAAEKAQKVMIDGVIYIRRGGKIYTLDGTEVE